MTVENVQKNGKSKKRKKDESQNEKERLEGGKEKVVTKNIGKLYRKTN